MLEACEWLTLEMYLLDLKYMDYVSWNYSQMC